VKGDAPVGERFSQVYLATPELLPDSPRMRRRLGHLYGEFTLEGFGRALASELGVHVDEISSNYDNYWPQWLEAANLRDVLDSVTVRYKNLKLPRYDSTGSELPKARQKFLSEARRIFAEENVRYRIDDRGGVHFTVDGEFERTRIATLSRIGQARYAGVRELFEAAFTALDGNPPDGKGGIRHVFFAAESLFRLMYPNSPQLNSGEVAKQLKPLVDVVYNGQKPAIHVAQKQLSAFQHWIDGAHFYRHEPGTEEPAQPPLDLAIYVVSQGAAHIRWLAQLDSVKP
jgi:hypothetical protein